MIAMAAVWSNPSHGAGPDLDTLDESVLAAYTRDIQMLRKVSFRRHVSRQTLDRRGKAKSTQVLVMRITPTLNGFDEALIEIDGRRPTDREIRKNHSAAVFTNHYRQLKAGQFDLAIVAELSLSLLLKTYDYTYEGDEEIHGEQCFRFSVKPFDPPADASATERIAAASEGEFWIAADSASLVRIESRIVRPLKTMGVRLNRLELKLDSTPWAQSWLVNRIEVRTEYRMVGTFRKRNVWTYSDFEALHD